MSTQRVKVNNGDVYIKSTGRCKSIREWIAKLPEPHKSNCWHSLTDIVKRNNFVMPSILSVLCMIDWKNGFAPESYYENLFNKLSNENRRD